MNNHRFSVLALAAGLTFGTQTMAQSMSKEQYQSDKAAIAAEHKSAKAACGSLSGNAKDICGAQASGNESFSQAELEARYKPSVHASYKVRIARADANYAVAKEECDDKAGNVKDVCLKEAKAVSVAAKADAKAQMQTSKAHSAASETAADARKDAAVDKRAADYAVAKEKCDVFAGDVKVNCINNARARFGKS
jgi:hypothetical protein